MVLLQESRRYSENTDDSCEAQVSLGNSVVQMPDGRGVELHGSFSFPLRTASTEQHVDGSLTTNTTRRLNSPFSGKMPETTNR